MSKNLIKSFIKDDSGATAIEYGLIAALVAVGIIGAASTLGTKIAATFNKAATTMANASN
jgi:pilus assembly protein Flp/PilA